MQNFRLIRFSRYKRKQLGMKVVCIPSSLPCRGGAPLPLSPAGGGPSACGPANARHGSLPPSSRARRPSLPRRGGAPLPLSPAGGGPGACSAAVSVVRGPRSTAGSAACIGDLSLSSGSSPADLGRRSVAAAPLHRPWHGAPSLSSEHGARAAVASRGSSAADPVQVCGAGTGPTPLAKSGGGMVRGRWIRRWLGAGTPDPRGDAAAAVGPRGAGELASGLRNGLTVGFGLFCFIFLIH
jgi:hypothetical protein